MPFGKESQSIGDGQWLGSKTNLRSVTNSKPSIEKKNELDRLMEKLELDLAKNNLNASGLKSAF